MSAFDPDSDTLNRLPTFLTVNELARLMRLDRKTLYEAVDRGDIPGAVRVGRTIRIVRSAVVHWLRDGGRVARSGRQS